MKGLVKFSFTAILILVLLLSGLSSVSAVPPPPPQVPLAGKTIPQFVDPLPILDITGLTNGTMVTADGTQDTLNLYMQPLTAKILPTTVPFILPNGSPYTGTKVFGYRTTITDPATPVDTYIGPVVLAKRGVPLQVKYINNLGFTDDPDTPPFWTTATDLTLHWANPSYQDMVQINNAPPPTYIGSTDHYGIQTNNLVSEPIPAVAHLHGGEVPPVMDGGPDAWFVSDGSKLGHAYYSDDRASSKEAWYTYPNTQEAAPLWFHDHVLGATRINVYAGLAGAYLISPTDDEVQKLPAGLSAYGLKRSANANPADDTTIPLVIQDRMFDINGQLFFPNAGINVDHPYWVPEFLGDVICVNGKSWPYLEVKAQRYRFLLLNGSNARTYDMFLQNPISGVKGPAMWVIATDGGYLDKPVLIDPKATSKQVKQGTQRSLVIMPGERYEVIIDFTGLTVGTNLILENTAKAPYPGGAPPSGATTGQIMQFRIIAGGLGANDTSFNPATPNITIRGGSGQLPATVKLPVGSVQVKRQLTLNEVLAPRAKINGVQWPGGPLEILVNNTKWTGVQPDGTIRKDFTKLTNSEGDAFKISGAGSGTIDIEAINAGSVLATLSGNTSIFIAAINKTINGTDPYPDNTVVLNSNSTIPAIPPNPAVPPAWTIADAAGSILFEATATLTYGTWERTIGSATTASIEIDASGKINVPTTGGAFFMPAGATYYSELPVEGQTELWEIVNLTADAHPIHLHLIQFQLMNRENLDVKAYTAAYNAAFTGGGIDPMTGLTYPAGVYMPGYGPPLDYNVPNADGAIGGNPATTGMLLGATLPPAPNEAGWKDTVMALPGTVTRLIVRWAPTDKADTATDLWFPFDPDGGHGYVWHCHIIDHEDNEMMRPTSVAPVASTITSISPPTGTRGATTIAVTITGALLTGATTVNLGAGITVNSFTVVSPTQITADISIDSAASLGLRNVLVTTPMRTCILYDGFTVVAGP